MHFGEEAVRQVREFGEPLSRMALELGVNYSTLRAWVKEEAESPPGERLGESERAELRRIAVPMRSGSPGSVKRDRIVVVVSHVWYCKGLMSLTNLPEAAAEA